MGAFIGIDIGSTSAKTVVLDENKNIKHRLLRPTGWSSIDAAEEIKAELNKLGFNVDDARIVATGYGRVNVPYADRCVTEITCHALGAKHIFNCDDMVIIDIGGQDTKIIEVNSGNVTDFIMNDKCSAGTGRFLEVMANTLAMSSRDMCELARAGGGVKISSLCTVFAESEIVGLIGRGESKENIACAVIDSIINKVIGQIGHINIAGKKVALTGGLCDYEYIIESLSKKLNTKVLSSENGRFAGAIGAAIIAQRKGD